MCVWAVALVSSVRPQAWFTLLALDSLDSLVHHPWTGFIGFTGFIGSPSLHWISRSTETFNARTFIRWYCSRYYMNYVDWCMQDTHMRHLHVEPGTPGPKVNNMYLWSRRAILGHTCLAPIRRCWSSQVSPLALHGDRYSLALHCYSSLTL